MSEPKKNDGEHARMLLRMAQKDLKAIENMQNSAAFDDEVFGFHAQQAIEKALKAWMAHSGIDYPLTHSINELLALLEEEGHNVSSFWEMTRYNPYAVLLRYGELDEDVPRNRPSMIEEVRVLFEHVRRRLADEPPEGYS